MQFKAASGSLDASMRASLVAAALDGLPTNRGSVSVKKEGLDVLVMVGDVSVITVTGADASKAGTSAMALAEKWASNLRQALQLPPLKLSVSELEVPVGAVRNVRIVGSKSDEAQLSVNGNQYVEARRTPDGMQIRALRAGMASVVVSSGGLTQPLNVTIRPFAAEFPQSMSAEVVGIPAAGSSVKGALACTLRTQLQGRRGVKFSYQLPPTGQLGTGDVRTYNIRVRAEAPDTFPNYGMVTLKVKNLPVSRRPDAELWYSNSPEVVTQARPLFSATLRTDQPARLLYHHINAATQPMYIRVQVVNSSDDPAKVVVVPGDSKPDRNPVRAGLEAADQYFRAWMIGSGEVVVIPPHATLPISLRRLNPGETSSGLCGLRLLEGPESLLVRTDSWPPFEIDAAWRAAIESSTPWREVGCPPINDFDRAPYEISEHVYPNPHKSEEMSYEVGGRYSYCRIGQRAIIRQDQGSQLDGNFGVIYNIKASLQNPTSEATDVEVVFEASAGYSGGLFFLNGSVIRTPLLQPKEEMRIARYRLAPGGTRRLDITTLPVSGSSYPATITIRPVQTDTALNDLGRGMRTVKH
ncbi:hypothetical protein OP10G_4533 [Fimbriimonas ginsengisoli Gsoil 348]|uniref:Uncharacterized protein n=2 Tax=Fimbriimonas ginsengisoli TaxID=1005039 RepID=A0A068NWT0_FIMGI|nr:hypothetical protein OP10G_4533 [Fimbriimonas ginsengisoli Gsoil 348]